MKMLFIAHLLLLVFLTSGCGVAGNAKEQSLARCERTFARMAPDPAAGKALCGCLIDRLEAEGLSIIETISNDRGTEIARQCAVETGVEIPQAE